VLFAVLWLGREESKRVYIYHSCSLTGRLFFFFFFFNLALTFQGTGTL